MVIANNLCSALIIISATLTFTNGATYKAMVVEYNPFQLDSTESTMLKNLNEYKLYIEKAKSNGVHIAVFPEYGLTGVVQDPRDYALDLGNRSYSDNKVVLELTHITKESGLYVVVNVIEKEYNSTDEKTYYYNTNVVLDRKGDILTKYRKINLDNQEKKYLKAGTSYEVFKTEFGVTFGLITGRDILFDMPSRRMFESAGVTDVIYPSAMVSVVPFFHSLSLQHGYAEANGINLLTANLDFPGNGLGGSGIYNSDGSIGEVYIDSSTSTKPIIRPLSINTVRQNKACTQSITPFGFGGSSVFGLTVNNISNFITERNLPTSGAKFKKIDFKTNTGTTLKEEICNGDDFCCSFTITVNHVNLNEVYKVMAFNGVIKVDYDDLRVRACALVACSSSDDSTCGARVDASTIFSKIEVNARLPTSDDSKFYQPLSLKFDLQTIDKTSYCYDDNNNGTRQAKHLYNGQDNKGVVAFGILGLSPNSANALIFNAGALLMSIMVIFKAVALA